jgi:hypothetical protein
MAKDRENKEVVEIKDTDIIEYSATYSRPYDVEYRRLEEIINMPVLIKDITIETFDNREVMHILMEDLQGHEFATRTSSSVLLKQLKQFEQLLKAGKKLKAKIVRRKRYYTLAPPQ